MFTYATIVVNGNAAINDKFDYWISSNGR